MNLLFVYGTLRMHARAPLTAMCSAEFVGYARTAGTLLHLGEYPGMIPARDTADEVRGEVYRLKDPDGAFRVLDDYEGPEFERKLISVRCNDSEVRAWAYLYCGDVSGKPSIASGEWN